MTASKVRFGLSNVYYAVETDEGYSAPVHIPGAVSLSLNREGQDPSKFFADNIAYWVLPATNEGYTGTLTMAVIPDQFKIDVLGEVVDQNGVQLEMAEASVKRFALMYEVDGDADKKRFVFFNCTAQRPVASANTKSDSTDPDTEDLEFTSIGKEFTFGDGKQSIVKGSADESQKAYAAWFTAVPVPTKATV